MKKGSHVIDRPPVLALSVSNFSYDRKSTANGINLERLQTLLVPAVERISHLKEQNIFLFVGRTGAGKSTTICAAIGCEMDTNDVDEVSVIGNKVMRFPQIGKGADAETLYPDLFSYEATMQIPDYDAKVENAKREISSLTSKLYTLENTMLERALEDDEKIQYQGLQENIVKLQREIEQAPKKLTKITETLNYCDLPGFGDTRGEEEKTCTAVSTQIAIRTSRSILGMAIVIEYSAFETERGDSLKKLLESLNGIITNPSGLDRSILFVITKGPGKGNQLAKLFHKIKKLKDYYEKEIRRTSGLLRTLGDAIGSDPNHEKQSEESETYGKILNILKKMNTDNVFFIDVSNDKTPSIIAQKLKQLQPIAKDQFRFNPQGTEFLNLEDVLLNVAKSGNQVCHRIIDATNEKRKFHTTIMSIRNNINSYEKLLVDLTNNSGNKSTNPEVETIMKDYDEGIKCGNKLIMEAFDEANKLEREKTILKDSKLELYWAEEAVDDWGLFSWYTSKTFAYPRKESFTYVEEKCSNGKFYRDAYAPEKALYKVTYKSGWFSKANGHVYVYLPMREIPKHKSRIGEIDELIKGISERISQLEKDVGNITRKNAALKETAASIEIQTSRTLAAIERDKLEEKALEQSIATREKIAEENTALFVANRSLYEMVVNLRNTFDLKIDTVDAFCGNFVRVLGIIPAQRTAITSSTASSPIQSQLVPIVGSLANRSVSNSADEKPNTNHQVSRST